MYIFIYMDVCMRMVRLCRLSLPTGEQQVINILLNTANGESHASSCQEQVVSPCKEELLPPESYGRPPALAPLRCQSMHHPPYRGISLIRNSLPLGPYSRPMSRALWWS